MLVSNTTPFSFFTEVNLKYDIINDGYFSFSITIKIKMLNLEVKKPGQAIYFYAVVVLWTEHNQQNS
jgi:hypothetical protein